MRLIATLTVLLVCKACGGSSSDEASAPGSTGADVASACTSRCGWQSRCQPATPPDCVEACVSGLPAPEKLEQSFLDSLAACFETLACGTNDDVCSEQAIAEIPLTLECFEVQDQCNNFSDDLCAAAAVFVPAAQAELDACLSLPCADVPACLGALYE